MPGMGGGLHANNATMVAAFQRALVHQGLVVLLLLFLLALAFNVMRALQLRRAMGSTSLDAARPAAAAGPSEPLARRVLRVSFGLLWVLDGLLQGQASMPLGLTGQVIQPSAAGAPGWVRDLVNAGVTIWNNHPVSAATAAVWIQIGIGAWLLVAPRGSWSRLGGLASLGWAAVVWVFGESFGGIFTPGASWLLAAPGAALFYALAGVLVALPERYWAGRRLGRGVIAAMGAFFAGMAVLQAWPGRGFWQGGTAHGPGTGTLATMTEQMSHTPQPRLFSWLVASFASFDSAHGFAVNLFCVVALAAIGVGLLGARPRIVRSAIAAAAVFCLADWLFVQDLGVFGGTGTDPNTMLPTLALLVAGYIAWTRPAAVAEVIPSLAPVGAPPVGWQARLAANPTYTFRVVAAASAVAVTLLGAAPMAVASTNPNADPIVAQAIDGTPNAVDIPAPNFTLVNQRGQKVSLASLRGRTIAMSFLDPVCVSDCPLIAQEFRQADALLGATARKVVLVAIELNPLYRGVPYLVAFDREEGLQHLANWEYLTGSLDALNRVWADYGMQVAYTTGGAMLAHTDVAYVIDASGHTRYSIDSNPGPGTAATKSSFAVMLAQAIRSVTR